MRAPPVIHTHHSNRTEALVQALAEVVARPCGGPFERETIVVQGRGMAAYLTQQLASHLGVWANPDFSFPRRYMERCLRAVWPAAGNDANAVTEERLTWLVLSEFERCLGEPEFERLARYLRNDPQGTKRFALARRLGTSFERYITFRPEMVRAFSQGKDGGVAEAERWQGVLWRRIEPRLPAPHWAAIEGQWHERVQALKARPHELPARVCLFGISSLPPQYLRVLASAGRWVETHVFVFSPSDQDWWNSATRSEWARVVAAGQDPDTSYVDPGHPLLSSCGSVGADFRRVLQNTFEELGLSEAVDERFQSVEPSSTLTRLQADIFRLKRKPTGLPAQASGRKRRSAPATQMALPFETPARSESVPPPVLDDSITVHACHSPMREVEVLKDQLLALMTRKQDPVAPHEVVVMMADVETYAPFVEAVFAEDPTSVTYVPFRIADQKLRAESAVVDAFFRALELVNARASAPAVVDLLTARAIERRLGLGPSDLDRLTTWVAEAGIRWGLDAADRASHGQPPEDQNTWRFGFDRLLLGFAMPTEGRAVYSGVMPYDEIEGKAAADLGVFVEFLETLFDHLRRLRAPRAIAGWREDLLALLEHLVGEADDTDWEHQQLRQALADMDAEAREAGFEGLVDLGMVRSWLEERVEAALPERGFLAGGVTFCAMIPMRSIPFRVVCLLGMNDGVFPRSARPTEFDLVARGPSGPQPGDRDRRLDDRYLFLETLCAARERLIVTYTGQSIRDNAVRPPSVLLNELYDALAMDAGEALAVGRRESVEASLVVRHPLQGFSRRYFDGGDERLWSYAPGFEQAAARMEATLTEPPPFLAAPLAVRPREVEVSLRDLENFWMDPLRHFLQRRVRVDLSEAQADIPSREPITLEPLERHDVGTLLLRAVEGGGASADPGLLVKATGKLPLGALGQVWLETLLGPAQAIADVARPLRRGPRPPLAFDRALGPGVRLVGALEPLFEAGLVRHQFGALRARQQLKLWLSHLVLCWLSPPGVRICSTLVSKAEAAPHRLWFEPVVAPEPFLKMFVEGFHLGQHAPLRFLPEASMAFAEPVPSKGRSDELAKACKAYAEETAHKPWWGRVAGVDAPPLDRLVTAGPSFERLALDVFQPLFAHRRSDDGGVS